MNPDVKFQSYSKWHFKDEKNLISAFLYADYSIDPHIHDFYEINIVLSGTGVHRIEDAHIKAKTGDVFVIPPMTMHAYYNTHNLNVYHILLHKNFILQNRSESNDIPGFLHLIEIEPFLRQHSSTPVFLHLSGEQLIKLKYDLDCIEDSGIYNTVDMIPLKNHTVWKILYMFSHLLFEQMNNTQSNTLGKYDQAIITVLEYIHQNYSEKITIDMLCKKAFLSRSTFLRSFYEKCNCTPGQYLNAYRCKRALEMTSTSGYSKTEIAHKCGFYDLSHMERSIKGTSIHKKRLN